MPTCKLAKWNFFWDEGTIYVRVQFLTLCVHQKEGSQWELSPCSNTATHHSDSALKATAPNSSSPCNGSISKVMTISFMITSKFSTTVSWLNMELAD